MIALGIDPDMKTAAIAVTSDVRVLALGLVLLPQDLVSAGDGVRLRSMARRFVDEFHALRDRGTTVDCIAVEGQRIYAGTTKNPDSILRLAQLAGAAVAAALVVWPDAEIALPRPADWKGTTAKGIHQAGVLARVGWKWDLAGGADPYCVPRDVPEDLLRAPVRASDWKHLVDAIGLGLWGAAHARVWAQIGSMDTTRSTARGRPVQPRGGRRC